jgi:hypothetical protein
VTGQTVIENSFQMFEIDQVLDRCSVSNRQDIKGSTESDFCEWAHAPASLANTKFKVQFRSMNTEAGWAFINGVKIEDAVGNKHVWPGLAGGASIQKGFLK